MLSADLYDRLLDGAWVSVQVTAFSLAWGSVVAVVFGVARLTVTNRLIQGAIRAYVEVLRGASAIVLLFWAYFALPLFGLEFDAFPAAVLALGLNLSAYGTEIVRGAVQAVPKGQTEASVAVHLSPLRRIWSIILPQAAITVIPPYGNLTIEILKASALVSLLPGVNDLMNTAQNMRRTREAPTEDLLLSVLIIYFGLALVATLFFRVLEWYFSRGLDIRRTGKQGALATKLSALVSKA